MFNNSIGLNEVYILIYRHQAKRAQSCGHKGHSGIQTPRPSLCNMYILLNIIFLCNNPQI